MGDINKMALNKLKEILKELNKLPGIIGSAIIKKDGEIVAKDMPDYINDDFMNMLSTIEGFIENMLSNSNDIAPNEVIIRGKHENIIAVNIGDVILVVMSNLRANLNNILEIIDDFSDDIKNYCNMLFENTLEFPIKQILSMGGRKRFGRDVDISIFRILRFINLRKYIGVDNETLMYYFGKELCRNLKFNNFDELSDFYEKYKLGEIQMISENPIKIRIYDCVSCAGMLNVGKPLCHFEAGFLSGYMENTFNKKSYVIETHCWGLGNEFCQFEIKLINKPKK
ncbi:4-vinyl reductase 4 [Methanocaldococcus bathoardescens]|uniref:4-vinyl reductase 4 n=1 Tax=Methanocaldococcus bathoardescens TaxID=1301915 RepID=A0A076LCQ8_9EURY|nr:DUF2507 domain-containing protein [Methanocaldococcus bathoardescens]AIJ06290.1 4-vinyl reductase 4 [Methanocaldococcus bathoardescens]